MARKKMHLYPKTGYSFGARLRAIRRKKGLTQSDLAKTLDVTQRTISYYENDSQNPTIATIETMARVLGVTRKALIDIGDPQPDEKRPIRNLQKRLALIPLLPAEDQRYIASSIDVMTAKRDIPNPFAGKPKQKKQR